jgi:hypothetical protein
VNNNRPKQSASPRDQEIAYSFPKIRFSLPDGLAAVRAEMNEAEQKCADARARFHSIDEQITAAEEKKTALRARIEQAGSEAAAAAAKSAAARLLGVAAQTGDDKSLGASIAEAKEELAALERQTEELTSMKPVAPELFQPLAEDLKAKIAAARAFYADLEALKVIDAATEKVIRFAETILAEARYARYLALNDYSRGVCTPPTEFLLFDPVELHELILASAIPDHTLEQTAPIVLPKAPEPPKAFEPPKSIGQMFKENEERAQREQAHIAELNERSKREGAEWRRKIENAKEAADNAHASRNPQAAELALEVRRLEAGFEEWRVSFRDSSARATAANAA